MKDLLVGLNKGGNYYEQGKWTISFFSGYWCLSV